MVGNFSIYISLWRQFMSFNIRVVQIFMQRLNVLILYTLTVEYSSSFKTVKQTALYQILNRGIVSTCDSQAHSPKDFPFGPEANYQPEGERNYCHAFEHWRRKCLGKGLKSPQICCHLKTQHLAQGEAKLYKIQSKTKQWIPRG